MKSTMVYARNRSISFPNTPALTTPTITTTAPMKPDSPGEYPNGAVNWDTKVAKA